MERYYRGKTGEHSFLDKPILSILELSPVGRQTAAVWTRGLDFAQVELFDLDSGEQLSVWNPRDRGLGLDQPRALAWMPDGKRCVLAVPNYFSCSSLGPEPDLFEVDALSGTILTKRTSGLLIGGVAVTGDERVWAADSDCFGLLKNHDPKLRVFDLRARKRSKELSGRGSGVRYPIAASRNGKRVAAFTGKIKVDFDWGDMVSYGVPVDRTFSVWDASNYQPLVSSQNVATAKRQEFSAPTSQPTLRMSPKGRFVIFDGTIYEIPDALGKN